MSYGVGFKSNQTLVIYSNKFCATINLAYFVAEQIVGQMLCGWFSVANSLSVAYRVPSLSKDIRK